MSVIGCGRCTHCSGGNWSLCDNSNPNSELLEAALGYSVAGMFGFSHAFGGYAGSHAEYVRVPYADFNCFPVPEEVSDTQAVFVSGAAPAGYMAAESCGIEAGDLVAVWGCGAVGLMAVRSAYLLGAGQVAAIDRIESRLSIARDKLGALIINYDKEDEYERLLELSGGRGPDRCIDAAGCEAGGSDFGRPAAIQEAVRACRKGGTLSLAGGYSDSLEHFPLAAVMNKGLTLHGGRQNGQKFAARIFEHIKRAEFDPSILFTHPMSLAEGRRGYEIFRDRQEGCVRTVFLPASG